MSTVAHRFVIEILMLRAVEYLYRQGLILDILISAQPFFISPDLEHLVLNLLVKKIYWWGDEE